MVADNMNPWRDCGTAVPFCGACLFWVGMKHADIDAKLGQKMAVARLRASYGRDMVDQHERIRKKGPKKGVPYGTSVPLCAACLFRVGMELPAIDIQLGQRDCVPRLRSHLGEKGMKLMPRRQNGGQHNPYASLTWKGASSAGRSNATGRPAPLKDPRVPVIEDIKDEVDHAYYNMIRIPVVHRREQRLRWAGYQFLDPLPDLPPRSEWKVL